MKIRILKLLAIIILIVGTVFYCKYTRNSYQIMTGETMNTYYRVAIRGGKEDTLLHNNIKEELQKINDEMSVFNNMSDISEFNRSSENEWLDIDEDLAKVLREAYNIYLQTGGHFDPSVGRLVDLWGFGTNKVHKIPTDEDIKNAMKTVGLNKILFSRDYRKAKKNNPDIYLNLSSIAKGYAVDRIATLLEKEDYNNFIVEIGGEVRAKGGRSKKEKHWNLGIARPNSQTSTEYEYIIRLSDMSVATSGDYRNYFYVDEKRYSHTINPKTGYPVEHNLASVTVFDKICMRADALATGIMAMGEKAGLEFVNKHKIPAVMFVHSDSDESFQVILSNEAKKMFQTKEIQTLKEQNQEKE